MALIRCGGGATDVAYNGYTVIRSNSAAKKTDIVAGSNTISSVDGENRPALIMFGSNVDSVTLPNTPGMFGMKKDGTVENLNGGTFSGNDYVCAMTTSGTQSYTFTAVLK